MFTVALGITAKNQKHMRLSTGEPGNKQLCPSLGDPLQNSEEQRQMTGSYLKATIAGERIRHMNGMEGEVKERAQG